MRKRILIVVAACCIGFSGLVAGCPRPLTAITGQEQKLLDGFRKLISGHQKLVMNLLEELQLQQIIEGKWSTGLLWVGIVLCVAGALLILPTIAGWFKWTIPLLSGGVRLVSTILSWCAARVNNNIGKGLKASSAMPRWGLWAIGFGVAAICASIWIDYLFTFVYWTIATVCFLIGVGITWESACLYYTGKFDIPGDGVKPACNTSGDFVDSVPKV